MSRREQPLVAGELYGLRTWIIVPRRLRAMGFGVDWPDAGRHFEATCQRKHSHRAPATHCRCGIYALHPRPRAIRDVFDATLEAGDVVAGIVAAWGDVEVHETGFRAQYARPVALLLTTPTITGLYEGRVHAAAARHRLPVLNVATPADLERYFDEHNLGLSSSAVGELLAPVHEHESLRRVIAARSARRSLVRLGRVAHAMASRAR